eukprot:gene3766-13827_t
MPPFRTAMELCSIQVGVSRWLLAKHAPIQDCHGTVQHSSWSVSVAPGKACPHSGLPWNCAAFKLECLGGSWQSMPPFRTAMELCSIQVRVSRWLLAKHAPIQDCHGTVQHSSWSVSVAPGKACPHSGLPWNCAAFKLECLGGSWQSMPPFRTAMELCSIQVGVSRWLLAKHAPIQDCHGTVQHSSWSVSVAPGKACPHSGLPWNCAAFKLECLGGSWQSMPPFRTAMELCSIQVGVSRWLLAKHAPIQDCHGTVQHSSWSVSVAPGKACPHSGLPWNCAAFKLECLGGSWQSMPPFRTAMELCSIQDPPQALTGPSNVPTQEDPPQALTGPSNVPTRGVATIDTTYLPLDMWEAIILSCSRAKDLRSLMVVCSQGCKEPHGGLQSSLQAKWLSKQRPKSALFHACQAQECSTLVTELLALGADPCITDSHGFAPMHLASDSYGFAPMHLASGMWGALIHVFGGADPCTTASHGFAPMHLASGMWGALIHVFGGADPCTTASHGFAPMHLASGMWGALIHVFGGADPCTPDSHGFAPMHLASGMWGALIHVFGGADPCTTDSHGFAPMHLASAMWGALIHVFGGADPCTTDSHGFAPMHLASGMWGALIHVFSGADPCTTASHGFALLHLASAQERSTLVTKLLALGADPCITDSHGFAPMHLASGLGDVSLINALLSYGAPANTPCLGDLSLINALLSYGAPANTPCLGDVSLINALLSYGAPANTPCAAVSVATDDRYPGVEAPAVAHEDPGAEATEATEPTEPTEPTEATEDPGVEDRVEVLKVLIAAGLEEGSQTDWLHMTPLHCAAKLGHTDVIERLVQPSLATLVDRKAGAAKLGHTEVIESLVQAGADVHAVTRSGYLALQLAASSGHVGVVRVLAKPPGVASYSRNALDYALHLACINGELGLVGEFGGAPLHLASRLDHQPVVALLLSRGAPLDVVDSSGASALHVASQYNAVESVKTLLEAGGNIGARNELGCMPLHMASLFGSYLAAELLVRAGASLDGMDSKGRTALHLACKSASEPVIRLLLDAGANVNAVDQANTTPLVMALSGKTGFLVVLGILIKRGAKLEMYTNEGQSPLYVACNFEDPRAAKLLLEV